MLAISGDYEVEILQFNIDKTEAQTGFYSWIA